MHLQVGKNSNMEKIEQILVTGGSGKTGRAVVATLADLGYKPRIAVRNPAGDMPANTIAFDWMDADTHAAAVSGIDAVYIVAPALLVDPVPAVDSFIATAIAAGVKRFVSLSSSAIPQGGPVLGQIHQILADKAEQWTVLQPSWFMQNFTEGHHGDSIRKESAIYSATGSAGIGFIDANDIGATAAHCLVADRALGRGIVLTGPTSPNYDSVAGILSNVAGRTIRHVLLSQQALAERFEKVVGMPADYANFLAGMDAMLAGGSEDRVTTGVKDMTGKEPRSFEVFAERYADVWRS
ncbi:NAD-dependent epimerase/dehydratase family protein [Exilibacterium tricleocarpae]|uniref:NAD-dependent epimerase/dehydratase family protein n=2 Tax=Exilibacterium tricleocarpae TaxID=2591008 RepID=A0A545TNE5_9GAMM|nr:NAD-dependent epimerase/dehydratase family protein [Exilibacterium tricleocarpae]